MEDKIVSSVVDKFNQRSDAIKTYIIRDREAGNMIEECISLFEAKNKVIVFENKDKKDGIFVDDFYEIIKK